jgi:hypothetical protein
LPSEQKDFEHGLVVIPNLAERGTAKQQGESDEVHFHPVMLSDRLRR